MLCVEFGNGLCDLLGLQLSDLFGVLLGDEVRELTSLLPGEELDVAVGVFFSGYNGLGSGGQEGCLLYTSPSPRDGLLSRMPSSA